jgi:hypothetical protein
MLCSSGYVSADTIPTPNNEEGPVQELLRIRQQNYELAQGLHEVKLDLATAEAQAQQDQEMYEAEKPTFFEKVTKSALMDVVYFIIGVFVGIKAVNIS